MTNDDDERVLRVTKQLNNLILRWCYRVATEQRRPMLDPDASDAEIKEGKQVIAGLRKCRDEIEELMTGVML